VLVSGPSRSRAEDCRCQRGSRDADNAHLSRSREELKPGLVQRSVGIAFMRVRDVRFLYTLLIVINVNFELRIFALSSSLMGGLFKPRIGGMRRFVLVT